MYWTTFQDAKKHVEVSGSCSNRVTLNSSATAHKFNSKTRKQPKSTKTTNGIYITTFDCVCGVLVLRLLNFTFFRLCLSSCRDPDRVVSIRSSDVLSWGEKGAGYFNHDRNFAASIFQLQCLKSGILFILSFWNAVDSWLVNELKLVKLVANRARSNTSISFGDIF